MYMKQPYRLKKMNNIYKIDTKYTAFSLLEMIITTFIIGFIMTVVALVLTTLIKVSAVTTNKTAARNDSEFVLELLRRNVKSSNPKEVSLYDSTVRTYNKDTGKVSEGGDFTNSVGKNKPANEIHFKPQGSQNWVCLAYYKGVSGDNEIKKDKDGKLVRMGYILKTTKKMGEYKAAECFTERANIMVLNSRAVNIKEFTFRYREHGEDPLNKIIQVDMVAQPVYWYFAQGAPINREVYRQAIISTESIKW